MAKRKPTTLRIGSVSHGTMREEDLIPSFLWEVDRLRLTRQERAIVRAIHTRVNNATADYWETDASDDVAALFDILDSHCPYFCYFGSHPGDGSDYGVWVSDAWEDEAVKVVAGDAFPRDAAFVAAVTDHGNVTLYRRAGNRWIEVWSVV